MSHWDFDLVALHGSQEMTGEDRAYGGSRYSDVRRVIFANPYRGGTSGQMAGPLPMFRSTIWNAWKGTFIGPNKLKQAAARAVDSKADLRWGADGKGFRRILAPNGICVLGTWDITTDYFKKGSRGLTIGRFSSDGNETLRGQRRSFSLGMKIYPTDDPEHSSPLVPASVIVQEDLGGMHTAYLNDAELRNEPNVTAYRRGISMLILVHAGLLFQRLDKVADGRQLHEVAELGKPPGEPTRTPRHMRIKMTDGQQRIPGDRLDFRDEIYRHLFKPGESSPSGAIEFDISVSDRGRRSGFTGFQRVTVDDWRRIGRLTFREAVASYNADHVIHFHHPGWRDDRNDAGTAIRSHEQRVR
jgi:hypothetical protein